MADTFAYSKHFIQTGDSQRISVEACPDGLLVVITHQNYYPDQGWIKSGSVSLPPNALAFYLLKEATDKVVKELEDS